MIPILETLSSGDICRNIVEDDYRYRIIKLIERSNETFSVEAITPSKQPYDEWFKKETAKVEIEIMDPDLRITVEARYPWLWWVRRGPA